MGLGLMTSSCGKDDDSPSDKSITELLTDHCWKLVNPGDDCEEDNIEMFNADGTYLNDLGTDLCDPTEENSTGSWELSEDEMNLTITAGIKGFTITLDFTIVEITENSMTLSFLGLGSFAYEPC